MMLAACVAGLGVYVYVKGVTYSTSSAELNDITSQVAGIYLLTSLVTALVLATIGAGAMAAGTAAKTATRITRERRPVSSPPLPPAYVAPPAARAQPPARPPAPVAAPGGPGPRPVDGQPQPPDTAVWGPPAGPPLR